MASAADQKTSLSGALGGFVRGVGAFRTVIFVGILALAFIGVIVRYGAALESQPWIWFWLVALLLTWALLVAALRVARLDSRRGNARTVFQNGVIASALLLAIAGGFFGIGIDPALIKAGSTGSATTAALGFLAVGIAIGFLFGLPKVTDSTVQAATGTTAVSTTTSTTATTAADGSDAARLRPNTNLEKVSDWLTTVITGLALTQLQNVPGYVGKLTEFLSGGLSGPQAAPIGSALSVTAMGMILHFPLTGFLVGYITTRLILTRAFDAADRSLFTVEEKEKVNFAGLLETAVGLFGANTPTPGDKETAQRIVTTTDPTSLLTSEEKATYARAQAVLGNYETAIPWYQAALALDKQNGLLYEQYAAAFYAAPGQDAWQLIPPLLKALELSRGDPHAHARVATNLVLGWLYVQPDGFIRSIALADALCNDPALDKKPPLYFYRACGYGDLWAALVSGRSFAAGEVPMTDLRRISERIFDDTRTALTIRPSLAPQFRSVAGENPDPEEDDLRVFASQNPEYLRLIDSYVAQAGAVHPIDAIAATIRGSGAAQSATAPLAATSPPATSPPDTP